MRYIAIPPGTSIREQMENKMMTEKELAIKMNMTNEEVKKLLSGNMEITTGIAKKLEKALGVPASFWNRLETSYRKKLELVKCDHC